LNLVIIMIIKGIPGVGYSLRIHSNRRIVDGTNNGLHRYDKYKQNIKFTEIPLLKGQKDWTFSDICFEPEAREIALFGLMSLTIHSLDMILFKKRSSNSTNFKAIL
jgi:hypothetical protein